MYPQTYSVPKMLAIIEKCYGVGGDTHVPVVQGRFDALVTTLREKHGYTDDLLAEADVASKFSTSEDEKKAAAAAAGAPEVDVTKIDFESGKVGLKQWTAMDGSSKIKFGSGSLGNLLGNAIKKSMTVREFVALDLEGKFNQQFARAVIRTLTPDNKAGARTAVGMEGLNETARTLQGHVRSWLSQQGKSKAKGKEKEKGK